VEFLAGLLPFAVFLICPLMMIFMMRGMHGGHGDNEGRGASGDGTDAATARKLASMELEIARLRGELDVNRAGAAKNETVGDSRRA